MNGDYQTRAEYRHDHNQNKMSFPIPTSEMQTNKALKPEDQIAGY